MQESSGMSDNFDDIDPDVVEQELARESAVRRLFALTRRRFRELQRDAGFTQQELAARMRVTPAQVSRWFANPSNMTVGSAAKILMAMGRKLELGVSDPFAIVKGQETPASGAQILQLQKSMAPPRWPANELEQAPLRLVAAPADHAVASEMASPAPPEALEDPIEIDGEMARFVYLGGRVVFIVLRGAINASSLALGQQSFSLSAIAPGSNTFHINPLLDRGAVTKFLRLRRRSPDEHPIGWS